MSIPFSIDGHEKAVEIRARRPDFALLVGTEQAVAREQPAEPDAFSLSIGGRMVRGLRYVEGDEVWLRFDGRTVHVRHDRRLESGGDAGHAANEILAEMPGTVIAIHTQAGLEVTAGERLLTIESMKLQVTIPAPRDGRIAAIHVAENTSFDRGVPLVSFAAKAEA